MWQRIGTRRRLHIKFPVIPSPFDDNRWCQDSKEADDDEDEDVDEDIAFDDMDYTDHSDFIAELFNEEEDEEEFEGFQRDDED